METIIKKVKEKVSGQNNLLAIALRNAINEKQDGYITIENIKDMAVDNYRMVRDILGKDLITDIINFKK